MPSPAQELALAEHLFSVLGLIPTCLEVVDKPDIRAVIGGRSIGLEVTDATPEECIRAGKALERIDWDGFISPSNFQHREERRPTQELIEEAIDPNSQWVETAEATRRWAARIKERILDKQRAFNHPDFERFDQNWLLIADLRNSPITHEPQVVTLGGFFNSALQSFRPESFFDHTFILTSDAGLIDWDHRQSKITWTISPERILTLP